MRNESRPVRRARGAAALALLLAVAAARPSSIDAQNSPPQVFFTLRHSPHFQFGAYEFGEWLDLAEKWKFGGIAFEVAWGAVERNEGEFDFRLYDKRVQEMLARRFALQVKLNLRYFPRDLGAGEQMHSADGSPLLVRLHLGETGTPTIADAGVVERMARFARETAAHFKRLPIVSYTPFLEWGLETAYDGRVWTDYSPAAVQDFRAFLRRRYLTIEALSESWGTKFADWGEVGIAFDGQPLPRGAADLRPTYLDFVRYREEAMRRFVDRMSAALKEGDPDAKLAVQVARLYSGETALRGGVGIFNWARSADEIIIDPAPTDDALATVDGIRAGKQIPSAEVTGPAEYDLYGVDFARGFRSQIRAVVQAGARRVYVANFNKADIEGFPFARSEVEKAVTTRAIAPIRDVAIYHSKWDLYAYRGSGYPELSFRPQDAATRPIDIISDDLFVDDPEFLKRYKLIYVPRGDYVSEAAHDALKRSGARLLSPRGTFGAYDESGVRRVEGE